MKAMLLVRIAVLGSRGVILCPLCGGANPLPAGIPLVFLTATAIWARVGAGR